MGPIDFVILGAVLLIVGLAVFYIIRAKKRGAKCIGCPSSDCCCSKSQKGGEKEEPCSCGCCGCGTHTDPSVKSGEEKPEA